MTNEVVVTVSRTGPRRRILSGELFTLADAISELGGESGHVEQYGAVTEKLNAALASVLDAARSVAFQEARARHIESTRTRPASPNGGADGTR